MQITTNGLTIDFKEITIAGGGSWHRGNPGDVEWSIVNFGMSWGISANLADAISAGIAEVALINSQFDVSQEEIYQMENERLNDTYHLESESEF
ncbi:hypothetical protein [Microcoleus sp. bin38.metabat.b11b12b14.051]|uniref:hypothetical protein n=1 Tax=Microcoleus sp. bin38.metabat.b11b12b14.051 TaxID=2742709 RepID=UPI0025F342BF|nr:hypothetical protein [Microcoleus sp. bin38.metabat.b11b12b14.051]